MPLDEVIDGVVLIPPFLSRWCETLVSVSPAPLMLSLQGAEPANMLDLGYWPSHIRYDRSAILASTGRTMHWFQINPSLLVLAGL
jgi:hypothetical protein